jgi:DNA-binding beta-propeller fold protein YncE
MIPDRRTFLAGGAAALVACGRKRGSGFPGYAFVANEDGQALAVVDLTAFAVVRHIPLGAGPTAVAVNARQPAAYALTPQTGAVHEIDTDTLRVRRKAQVARAAITMRLDQDGRSLWVLCQEPRQLVRVDLDSFRAQGAIALPGQPAGFDLTRDGRLSAVSFPEAGSLSFADLVAGRAEPPIKLGGAVFVVRFRPDAEGRQLLVGHAEQMLSILDVKTRRKVVSLPLAVEPEHFCFSADGGQLFVTGKGMDAVVVVYPYQTEVAETVLAGRAPGAMAASPRTADASAYLFIANPESRHVTVMSIELHRAIAVVGVGDGPASIVITPDDQYALVLNQRSGDMAVIRIAAIQAKRAKMGPLFTMIPVGSKPVSAAVRRA